MRKAYKTIFTNASAEIEEKKSRFIANLKPVQNEADAVEFINSIKSKYWNATHNVYAYYIADDSTIQKTSDDGEPSGTAGLPVLEVIHKQELQNLVIVITRYFGGTLLGASGLARAYGRSAKAGIEAALVVSMVFCHELEVTASYALLGKLQSTLTSEGFNIKGTKYDQDIMITVFVPVDMIESFHNLICEITNGKAVMNKVSELYIMVDEKGKYIRR